MKARGFLRASGCVGLGLLAVFSAVFGGFLFALSRGPIVFDWLAPVIVGSLDELYAPRYVFGLDRVAIANTDHGPTLAVQGLTVKTEGRTIVVAPRAELSVDLKSLLVGRVKPRRLEMLDLELRLAVMSDGRVAVSAGVAPQNAVLIEPPSVRSGAPDAAKGDEAPERARPLALAGAGLRALSDLVTSPTGALGAIDRIGVAHGRLVIDDRTIGRVISYDDLTLSLDKGAGGMKFSLAATGATRRWAVVATAAGAPGERRVFDAGARDFSLDELELLAGLRYLPFDIDAPMSAQLHFALDVNDRVVEAEGGVHIGSGFFRLDEPDFEPVMIETLSGSARWDRENRQFVLSPIKIKTGAYDATLEGALAPPPSANLAPLDAAPSELWTGSLRLVKPTLVGPERKGQAPLRLDRAALRLELAPAQKKLVIQHFEINGPPIDVSGSLVFDWVKEPHVAFGVGLENTQLQAVIRLLPTHIVAPVRSWLMEHVPAGVIRRGEYNAEFTMADLIAMRYELPPPDAAIHAEGDLVDVTMTDLLSGLPPLTGLSTHMRLTGRTLRLENGSAVMDTAHERRLTLTDGSYLIGDTFLKPAPATLDLRFAGSVEAVAEILSTPALAPYAGLPVDAAQLKGQIDGRLRTDMEVGDHARSDHSVVAFDANTTNLSVDKFLGAERLEGGALNIVQDRSGLRVAGSARLFGGAAALEIHRAVGEKSAAQAQLSMTLDDAARAKAGWGVPGVVGPIVAVVKTPLPLNDADMQVELDLSRASLDNAMPGMAKPVGKPAKATFTLARRSDAITLDHFALDAGATQLSGVVELARDGAFRSAKLSQFRLSAGDDVKLEAQRNADALKLTVRGVNMDARPFLRTLIASNVERGAQSAAGKSAVSLDDVDVDFKSPLVTGFRKQILSNVDLKWERRGAKLRAFTLTGNFGREPLALALVRNQNGAPQMEISCGDGGSLLSFLDLYGRMESGALNASVQLTSAGRSDGVLNFRDFYLKNEPAMRQLMTQGAHRYDEKGTMHFDPESVRVARLDAAFVWSNGKLALREGILSGPEMGLTFDGYLDLGREALDISGSYVPLYGLNSLFSGIPVFGVLLAGGVHEGVFALNYRVIGEFGAPGVSVYPLSALTPGVFRKIMGVMDGTVRLPEQQAR